MRSTSICTVLLAAVLLIWPALYNGYPLLYPDSMSYLQSGRPLASALVLHNFADYYGGRSFIYCLGILPLHWNITLWPIVSLNAIMTAYVLWLVARSLLPRRTVIRFFGLVILLSALTSLGWFVSWIMPDIFGPVLYLSIYLLVFAHEELRLAERLTVILIAWWAVATHITHFMLAAGLCLLLIPVLALQRQASSQRIKALGAIAIIVLTAALAQIALHTYLYGEPSLNGKRAPFLMARVIADGPGRWYLQQRCGEVRLAICEHVRQLPDDVADFLWAERGIWRGSTSEHQDQLRREEIPLVLRTLRAYPWQELRISTVNFWRQLENFGLYGFDPNPWILEMMDTVLPSARTRYLQTRQAREALNEDFFTSVQEWTVMASLVVIGVCMFVLRRFCSQRLVGLTVIILSVVIANAAVTGVLSNVEDRYQSRVIWLVPLLAGILIVTLLDGRHIILPPNERKLSWRSCSMLWTVKTAMRD